MKTSPARSWFPAASLAGRRRAATPAGVVAVALAGLLAILASSAAGAQPTADPSPSDALAAGSPAAAEQPAASPPVTVEAVTVTPTDPDKPAAVDSLVKLAVRIANRSATTVTAFHFRVTVGGVALPVYDKQNFLVNVPPGEEREVELYNFWTTETGRPAPADGKLTVEVALDEAYPVELSTEEDGTEVWSLGEPLAGLTSARRIVVDLTPPKPAGGP